MSVVIFLHRKRIIFHNLSLLFTGLNTVTVSTVPQPFHHLDALHTLWVNLLGQKIWKTIQSDSKKMWWKMKQKKTDRWDTLKRDVWKWGQPYKQLLVFVTYETFTGLNCWQPQRDWQRSPVVFLASWKNITENANKQGFPETEYL